MATTGITLKNLDDIISQNQNLGFPQDQQGWADRLRSQDPYRKAVDQKRLAAIAQLANLDQRLAAVHADVNSKYYIERPTTRENIYNQVSAPLERNAEQETRNLANVDDQIDKQAKEVFDYYRQLKALEAQETKRTTSSGKTSTGKSTGKSSSSTKVTNTSMSSKGIEALRKKAGLDIAEFVGMAKSSAQSIFLNAPEKFQEEWLRWRLQGGNPPEGGFSETDVRESLRAWSQFLGSTKNMLDTVPSIYGAQEPQASQTPQKVTPTPTLDRIRQLLGK